MSVWNIQCCKNMSVPYVNISFASLYHVDIHVTFHATASEMDSSKSDTVEKEVPSLFGALGLVKKTQKQRPYKRRGWSNVTNCQGILPLPVKYVVNSQLPRIERF